MSIRSFVVGSMVIEFNTFSKIIIIDNGSGYMATTIEELEQILREVKSAT